MHHRVAVLLMVLLVGCSGLAPTAPTPESSPSPSAATTSSPATTSPPNGTTTGGTMQSGPPADPDTDVLGWEGGVWHNESLAVTTDDGLNSSELSLVRFRTMARIEILRGVEFQRPVIIEVESRDAYDDTVGGTNTGSAEYETFENVRYEALYLVPQGQSGTQQASEDRTQRIQGYYSPRRDRIVLVVDRDTTATGPIMVGEGLLAHELTHVVQVRHFGDDLTPASPTRDGLSALRSVVEGEATHVMRQYWDRCGDEWDCITHDSGPESVSDDESETGETETEASDVDGDSTDQTGDNASVPGESGPHRGFLLEGAFPYVAGQAFVGEVHGAQGWRGVEGVYDELPASTEQIIYPSTYPDDGPDAVSLPRVENDTWERVQPTQRSESTVLGAKDIAVMFAYTARDGRPGNVLPDVDSDRERGRVEPSDYRNRYVEGWGGDRFAVYQDPANRTAYVWRISWDSRADAREFTTGYRALLDYWGADKLAKTVWRFPDSSRFDGTVTLRREGAQVTIIHESERGALAVEG